VTTKISISISINCVTYFDIWGKEIFTVRNAGQ